MLISLLVVGATIAVAARLLDSAPAPGERPEGDSTATTEEAAVDSPVGGPALAVPVDVPDAQPVSEPDDAHLDRGLALGGAALALNAASVVAGPALALVSVVPLTIVTVPFLRRAWQMRHDPERRWVAAVDSIGLGGTLVTGHFAAASLGATLIYGGMKALRRTRRRTNAELEDIFGELPATAWVQRDGVEVEVALADVRLDDRVVVRAGRAVPVDGVVVAGVGAADERALTGEAAPALKSAGAPVFASTLITEGPLVIEVTRTGADTTVGALHRILQSTDDLTEHYRSTGERFIERGALPTLALSAITLPLLGVSSALAVSFASFGYHMRLAAPLSVLSHVALAARQGILVKDGRALELLGQVDVVLFDKTGTLTAGAPEVVAIRPAAGIAPRELIRWAATAEAGQSHPIARAILDLAALEGVALGVRAPTRGSGSSASRTAAAAPTPSMGGVRRSGPTSRWSRSACPAAARAATSPPSPRSPRCSTPSPTRCRASPTGRSPSSATAWAPSSPSRSPAGCASGARRSRATSSPHRTPPPTARRPAPSCTGSPTPTSSPRCGPLAACPTRRSTTRRSARWSSRRPAPTSRPSPAIAGRRPTRSTCPSRPPSGSTTRPSTRTRSTPGRRPPAARSPGARSPAATSTSATRRRSSVGSASASTPRSPRCRPRS